MTVIVIQFDRASADAFFSDESLETVQFLLGQGCYGPISRAEGETEAGTLWSILSSVLPDARRMEISEWSTRKDSFGQPADPVLPAETAYLHVQSSPASRAKSTDADAALASLLSLLSDDDVVALIASEPSDPAYLIVAKGSPVHGPARPATAADLALTLLALAGLPRPDGIQGKALFSETDGSHRDDEAELRERFRGLGYIA
jgi:hypothetical protein